MFLTELIYKEVMNSEEKTKNGVVKGQPSPSGTHSQWITNKPTLVYFSWPWTRIATNNIAYSAYEQVSRDCCPLTNLVVFPHLLLARRGKIKTYKFNFSNDKPKMNASLGINVIIFLVLVFRKVWFYRFKSWI